MVSAVRAMNSASRTAPLPKVAALRSLYDYGVLPRSGQLIVVFGQPACGKSTFAQWWANEMDVSTLYFMADSDPQDTVSRLGAQRSGLYTEIVADMIADKDEYLVSILQESKIEWCYDSSPSIADIAEELSAYVELYDEYPRLIVIDNAMNIEGESIDEQGGLKFVFKELHRLAHETGITVLVLHHAREEGDPTKPPRRDQMAGKVAQLPEIILGVALDGHSFHLAAVKNRSGKQDPTGEDYVTITADVERSSFRAYTPPVTYHYGGQQ